LLAGWVEQDAKIMIHYKNNQKYIKKNTIKSVVSFKYIYINIFKIMQFSQGFLGNLVTHQRRVKAVKAFS
jgi:hypothetical protein